MQLEHSPAVAEGGGGGGGPGSPRMFRDTQGVIWRVGERAGQPLDDGPPRKSLVFETDSVIRRVYIYPTNWRELADAELERLSWGR